MVTNTCLMNMGYTCSNCGDLTKIYKVHASMIYGICYPQVITCWFQPSVVARFARPLNVCYNTQYMLDYCTLILINIVS